jgi:hypothetical protein
MLEQLLSPDFWKSQRDIVMSAPFHIVPLLFLALVYRVVVEKER